MTQEEHVQQTIEKSIEAFWNHEKEEKPSIFEFLYFQYLFIRKRWWALQFMCLIILWTLLNLGFSQAIERKAIAVIIPIFTLLILPELWKSRKNNMEDIENSSVHTIRDIYLARLILFGAIDLFGLTTLWLFTFPQGIENMIFELLIPFNGICILMLGCLAFYPGREPYLPISLCLLFTIGWLLIISNENLYRSLSYPLWLLLFLFSCILLIFMVCHLIQKCKEVQA